MKQFDPCPREGLIKSLLSVYLSICLYVHWSVQHFSQGWLISFFWISCQFSVIIGIFKNWQSLFFSREIHFCPKFGQKRPKVGFVDFLKNFLCSFSWKLSKMKTNIAIDISPPIPHHLANPTSGLKLLPKMLSANQIAGFFTM